MKYLLVAILAAAGTIHAAVFTGVITDSHCGAAHTMMKDQGDAACVKLCVKGSGQYALFDGQNVLKLSDQKTPGKFVAQKVKVTGTLDEKSKSIKVTAIEAVNP